MTSGFRAECRAQAGAAIHALGSWLGRYSRGGTGRIAGRAGCLILFPFITLFVWLVQAIVWVIVALPILAYALVMAIIGGGFRREPGQPLSAQRPQNEHRSRVRTAEDDARPYVGRDGGM